MPQSSASFQFTTLGTRTVQGRIKDARGESTIYPVSVNVLDDDTAGPSITLTGWEAPQNDSGPQDVPWQSRTPTGCGRRR